ncbi:MAG: hypothetical protein ACM31D_05530 [Bacteroidota bacterium]
MANPLSLDDFIEMLGLLGADVAEWPVSDGMLQEVAVLLIHSQAARDAVAEMREIEGDMRRDLPRAPVGLADRILATALGSSQPPAPPIRVRPRVRRAGLH